MDRYAWLRRCVILLVGVPLVAAAATLLASLVPDRMILDSLIEGVQRDELINVPQVGVSGRGLDVFSDCIAVTMGLGDTEGGTATLWLRSPTLGSCDGAIASIETYAAGGGLSGGYEYFRYWHGYTVVSRPLLATIGIAGQRIVLFWAFIGVAALFARRLWRFHGPIAPFALLGPFLLTSDSVELARSLPHGLPALAAVGGAWAVHRAATRPPSEFGPVDAVPSDALRVATVAFLAGAIYVFVDLLTTPPGAWALVACMAMLASADRLAGRRLVALGALAASAWIVGWVWTWVSKWMLAAAVVGFDRVRSSVGDAVDDRIAGERDYIDLAPLNAIEVNVRMWMEHPLTPWVLVVVAVAAAVLWSRPEHRSTWQTRVILAAPALIPLIWFEVLRNHSLVHPRFVHRSLAVSAGIVALALLVGSASLRAGSARRSPPWQPEQTEDEGTEHELRADRHGGDRGDHDAHRL